MPLDDIDRSILVVLRRRPRASLTEVSSAVVAATLTTIAVFFPMVFISGIAGQLFRDQALTVSFSLLVLGVANYAVAGQAWINRRVDYRRRAMALGLYETSWALALLIGAPIVAVLINLFGWRGPFVVLAIASAAATLLVASSLPRWVDMRCSSAGSTWPGSISVKRGSDDVSRSGLLIDVADILLRRRMLARHRKE